MIIKRKQVVLTPFLGNIVEQIDPYADGHIIRLTSGVRTPIEQLDVIAYWALKMNVKFPEFDRNNLLDKVVIDGRELYTWQRTWSKLLNLDIIVNPPLAAECLDDYIVEGHNKKGEIIQGSPHERGTALDFVSDEGISVVLGVIKRAQAGGVPIKSCRVERKQYCVHVDVRPEVPK